MSVVRRATLLLLFCHTQGCVALPYLEPNVCGNGVRESGEYCDTYPNVDPAQSCRPPGTVGECHFDCSTQDPNGAERKPAHTCPTGMSCGTDGVCRKGDGLTFEHWNDFPSLQAKDLRAGDIDGNGFSDLVLLGALNQLWEAEPRALFFDANGAGTALWEPLTALRSLTLFPLTTERDDKLPRQQIIGGTQFGIAVLEANGAPEIFAVPNPLHTMPVSSNYRMARLQGVADAPLRERVLIYDTDGQISVGNTEPLVADMGRSVNELLGDLVAGNVVDDATSPCDELVATYRDDTSIYLLSVCDPNGSLLATPGAPRVVARLPSGVVATSSTKLAYLNDDEHLDLVLETNSPSSALYIAFGAGDGTFSANPDFPSLTADLLWPLKPRTTTLERAGKPPHCAAPTWLGDARPLAIGDLNADGHSDWVLPHGIQLATGLVAFDIANQTIGLEVCPSNMPFGKTWSIATIADLNGDDRQDVVAGANPDTGLDLLLSKGLDRLNPVSIRSDGPVKHLITGDYDGDLTTDVAFVQDLPKSDADTPGFTHSLAIAFGEARSTPNSPVTVARFSTLSVEQLLSANYETDDAIEEIGLLTRVSNPTAQQLTLFVGNRGRHPIASLGLWSIPEDASTDTVIATPITSTVGHFWNDASFGILALARDNCAAPPCKLRFWYLRNVNNAFELPLYSQELAAHVFEPIASANTAAYLVAGRLGQTRQGPPQLDDALLVSAGSNGEEVRVWQLSLTSTQSNNFAPLLEPDIPLSVIPGRLTSASSPILFDLDGDTRRDLVLLLGDPTQGEQRLWVLWNGPQGFASSELQAIGVEGLQVNTLVVATVAGEEQLYVTTSEGAHRIDATRARETTSRSLRFPTAKGGEPLPGGHAIAVGDVTGDGIPDVALSGARGLSIYQGVREAPEQP